MNETKIMAAEKLHTREVRRIERISRRWKITQILRNLLRIKDMRKYWVFEATVTGACFSTYKVLDRTMASSFCAWSTVPVRADGHTQRNGLLYALNYVYGPFYDSNHAAVWARRKTEHENAATLSSWMQG